jgi:hypothetical protein
MHSLLFLPKIYEKTFVICGSGKTGGLRVRHEKSKRHVFIFLHHGKVKKEMRDGDK